MTYVIVKSSDLIIRYLHWDYIHYEKRDLTVMYDRCPSKSMRNLKAKIYKCRGCGAEVEMFSDEIRTRCRKCRQFIYKEQSPYCVEGYLDIVFNERKEIENLVRQEIDGITEVGYELEIRTG